MSLAPPLLPNEAFDECERWPVERWRQLQWDRLGAVVRFAYDRLPFYRRRFEAAGLGPEDVRSPEDLGRLPLLRKAEVLAEQRRSASYAVGMEATQADEAQALGMTSGSQGTAILSYPDAWRQATGDAASRAYWWAGLRPGMQMLMAAPAWHCMAIRQTRVAERLGVRCVVPWGTFLPRFAGRFLDALQDLRPEFVCLFLPMVYALMAECRRQATPPAVAFSSVKSVLLGGAPITPRARERLQADLGVTDVFDSAGSSEGLLSAECAEHDGVHYFVDVCYVEIVDPDTGRTLPPGQRGSMVTTSLVPHGSVYLRYDTEDIAEMLPSACACGCSWPRLKIYDHRVNAIQLPGASVLWYDVRACLDELPELAGLPCAVIRGPAGSPLLRLAMERPEQTPVESLSRLVGQLLGRKFGVETRLEWMEKLPARWKGATVIDERDWGGGDG